MLLFFSSIATFSVRRNLKSKSKEISQEPATSKESKQTLRGCYMGTFAAGEIEEIGNRISKCKCLLSFLSH